jgi:diadenosine tetraphosphatase ApaH/serine/threonine PP2A family protein phosphatase
MRLAFFGGIYSNAWALAAAIADARRRRAGRLFCLGDLGAFGPHPDRVFPILKDAGVACVQGNYDHSIGHNLDDCSCGYTDPRDNHFAQISYEYTYRNTSQENRAWLRDLPSELRFEIDGVRFLLCHGSPRRTNEFLWESTTSTHFLEKLADDRQADVILATHTGIHWERRLSGGRRFANVGVLGRPENDGRTGVWYALVHTGSDARVRYKRVGEPAADSPQAAVDVEFVPVCYDHQRLAAEMREERLPEEFIETIETGWWTTCLEVLPAKERRRGRW